MRIMDLTVTLDPKLAERMRDNYKAHQFAMAFFAASPGRVLYRLDGDRMIVRAPVQSWRISRGGFRVAVSRPSLPEAGSTIEVLVRLASVKACKAVGSRERGRLTPITDGDQMTTLAQRKLEAAGLDIVRIAIGDPVRLRGTRDGQAIVHTAMDVAAVVAVANTALLADALANGIGRGRAFGCGLLAVC